MTEIGPQDTPQETPIEELAERVRLGDTAAESEIVRIFHRAVRAYVVANTGDTNLGEELAQEVLWAVIRALREGRVQQPAQLPAFVRGTARNLIHDHAREQAREKLSPLRDEIARPAIEQHAFERNHAALQAIARLEKDERIVLMLSLVEGLGPEEVANRLGVSAEVVRQRKSRALRRLRL